MAITITIDNDTSTVAIDKLVLDESSGTQTPSTLADTGNDTNLDFTDPTTGLADSDTHDATLSGTGYSAAFLSFIEASTIFGYAGLQLTDAQLNYAATVEGALSAPDLVTVTASAGEEISDLYFSDSNGQPLNGDPVFLADGVTHMQTLDGSFIYLWSDGDYCIATTSNVAGAGRVVAAFYLNEDTTDHLTAQIQMVTFEPLKHPDGGNADDALNFTNVLQVSAAGTVSFNFDNLPSGSFLYAAVGSTSAGILVTGQDLNVIDTASKQGDMVKGGGDPSDSVNTSQGGIGATIGINSQHFTDISGSGGTRLDGAVGVFTLVQGFTSFDATINGTSEGTGTNVNEIGYSDYLDAPSAKIFISQVTGSSSIGGAVRISLWEAGGGDGGLADHAAGTLTPEQGYGTGRNAYIGDDGSDQNLKDDWAVTLGSVTVKRGATTYTWTSGNSGATQGGITVTFGTGANANTFTVTGLITSDTIGFAAADNPADPLDGTFNRFDVQALANSNPVDIGRIDLDQGVSISQGVGGDLIVQDDGPTMSSTAIGAPSLTVDDTTLATNDTKDFSGQFTPSYGTDGPGSTAVTYALSTPGGDSGIIDTITHNHVFLFLESGKIVGREGTSALDAATGDIVFEVSVASDGNVTLDQKRAVTHLADTGTDQSTTLSSAGLVVLTATAHDGDTDTASANLNIGTFLNFKDDAPTITSQIQDTIVQFADDSSGSGGSSLNGSVGADVTDSSSHQSAAGVLQYTITSWDTPTNVYSDLNAVLSTDGATLTYYSDLADTDPVYQLTLNQTANSGAGSYTFTVLAPPPIEEINLDFTDLPSGQNLMGVIAFDKTNIVGGVLPDGGLLVFPTNPVLFPDGTFTNTSGTINTSKGGGPVTIGNGNQAFDHNYEGAWFCYVDNPTTGSVGGVGLNQVSADDADTVQFDGTIEATRASVEIVQASGAGTTKRPGPSLQITAYDINPQTVGHLGDAGVETDSDAFVLDPTTTDAQVSIIEVVVKDANGNVVEDRTNDLSGITNGGSLANGSTDHTVGISFQLDDDGGTPADHTDDIYSVIVSQLKAGYTVEFVTADPHDLAKVQNVSGSYDIGGYNIFNQTDIPQQDFNFSVQITDYDNDIYGGSLVTFANFGVTVDGITF